MPSAHHFPRSIAVLQRVWGDGSPQMGPAVELPLMGAQGCSHLRHPRVVQSQLVASSSGYNMQKRKRIGCNTLGTTKEGK